MESSSVSINARRYLDRLTAAGRYNFSSGEARTTLGVSADAAKLALNRLAKQNLVASPSRGFYVIVPPEFRSLGCLPADQFIPALMEHLNLVYYAGLLTAAQYYGAAHHRPQEFQVFLKKKRLPIICGLVRVAVMVRKRVADVAVQSFNTPRGTIAVSTPEATALDLVGYERKAGGFDHVATVLSELAEQIDPDKLATAATTAPVAWAQRLGYLLELLAAGGKAAALKDYVRHYAKESTELMPG